MTVVVTAACFMESVFTESVFAIDGPSSIPLSSAMTGVVALLGACMALPNVRIIAITAAALNKGFRRSPIDTTLARTGSS